MDGKEKVKNQKLEVKNIEMKTIKIVLLILYILFSIKSFAQSNDDDTKPANNKSRKGFHGGIYTGVYFANKSTANIYDGYGFDPNGNKNDFTNSFMNQSINYYYAGLNGQTDQIAQALSVNHGDWSFNPSDMPTKVKYNPGISVGFNFMYGITQRDAFIFNANATRLTLTGAFTIELNTTPINPTQPGTSNVQMCSITGGEQRALFQMGYRKILGNDKVFNFFIEEGIEINMTKEMSNKIIINTLQIDLNTNYNNPYLYNGFMQKYLSGVGLGAFAGIGLNITANAKCNFQLVYEPSYEKINIGFDKSLKLQNTVGLRIYYLI